MFKRTRRVESVVGPVGSEPTATAEAIPPPAARFALPNASSAAPAVESAAGLPAQPTVEIGGVAVRSKAQAVIVDPDADLSQFRQLPDTDRSDPEFFAKNWKGEKTVMYALFMRQRFPFWKAIA